MSMYVCEVVSTFGRGYHQKLENVVGARVMDICLFHNVGYGKQMSDKVWQYHL